MAESDRFLGYMKNARKRLQNADPAEIREKLEESFTMCMKDFPEEVQYDLLNYAIEQYLTGPEAFDDVAERLQRYIELFEMNFDNYPGDLPDKDWELIRDVVNESALDMDTKLVAYIMQKIVERGLI